MELLVVFDAEDGKVVRTRCRRKRLIVREEDDFFVNSFAPCDRSHKMNRVQRF